ncbi:A24 family peptidase [soil metagenome]
MVVVAFTAGILGAAVGSFLNVVAYRVPLRRSVISPPSACPGCGSPIRARDNVPVISWLILRGRCRDCGTTISWRYPAVELATALFFLGCAFLFPIELTAGAPELVASVLILVAFLFLAAVSVVLTSIDLDTKTLPNRVLFPSYAVLIALLGAASLILGEPMALLRGAIGLLALGGLYFALAAAVPGGMGMGDVKLAGLIGFALAWLGWAPLLVGAAAAFILGGVFGIILILMKRAGRKSSIPFGPWMLAGTWVGIAAGDRIGSGYLRLFGIS